MPTCAQMATTVASNTTLYDNVDACVFCATLTHAHTHKAATLCD